MQVAGRHWVLAFSAAVLVHVGLALALLWQPPERGAMGSGMGGVRVSLGATGGTPGSAAPVAPETPDTVEPVETQTAEPAEPPVEATPVETVATEAEVETSASRPVEEASALDAPRATPAEAGRVVEQQAPAEATLAQQPSPTPETSAQEEVVARAVTQRRPPKPKPEPVRTEPASEPEQAAQTAQSAEPTALAKPAEAGVGGKAGTQANAGAGSANDSSGGGMPGETADYLARLRAWLEKHKQYPRRAQLRRQEGTALLHVVMNREGRVLEYELRQSSGHEVLDREVRAMIERAEPLPKIPEAMRQSRLEVVVPVQFFLR